jgi:hypothetical protein
VVLQQCHSGVSRGNAGGGGHTQKMHHLAVLQWCYRVTAMVLQSNGYGVAK